MDLRKELDNMEKDIIGRKEEVTAEGVVDTIIKGVSDVKKMFRPLNISTTERLLNFVSELNKFNSDKRTSFVLHMQLGSYGEEKIDVSLINTGIRFLQKFLSAGTGSRIIIPKNYSDKSIGYKYSLISKPYNAYLDNRNNTDELLLKEVAEAFSFNLLLKYAKSWVKYIEKGTFDNFIVRNENRSISKEDAKVVYRYAELAEKVSLVLAKEFKLVEDEATVTTESANEDTPIENMVINMSDVLNSVNKKDISISETLNKLLEEKLCTKAQ